MPDLQSLFSSGFIYLILKYQNSIILFDENDSLTCSINTSNLPLTELKVMKTTVSIRN